MRQRDRRGTGMNRLRRDESGVSLVEFALVLPIFALLLFGLIDFGLIFGGYIEMRSGVQAGARLASVDDWPYSLSPTCTGGPDADTRQMVCNIAADIGSLQGVTSNSTEIGIKFPNSGSTTVDSPVEICAQATLHSTTGLTSPFISGRTATATSTLRLEKAADFAPYTTGSTSVVYNGITYAPMACS